MKYYRVKDDINFKDRWYLGEIDGVDNWELRAKALGRNASYKIEVVREGEPLDFSLTEAFAVPVVSKKVKAVLESESGLFFSPLEIGSLKDFYCMSICNVIDCIDENASDFQRFSKGAKKGEYQFFFNLVLNSSHITESIFRLRHYEQTIIIDEDLKKRLSEFDFLGLLFEEVSA